VKRVVLDLQPQSSADGGVRTEAETSRRLKLSSVRDGELVVELRLKGEQPAWLEPTIRVMAELLRLPENWSSYPARPVEPEAVAWALDLLSRAMQPHTPAPSVIPTSRGDVELEWHTRGIDLEVHAASPGQVYVYYEDHVRGKEEELELGADLSPLVDILAELSRRG
jgi:hypothetical protein